MCLVVAFSNSKKLDIRKSANVIGPMLLEQEQDGFGYAVQGKKGQFGEKYVGENFRSRLKSMHLVVQLPLAKKEHQLFGDVAAPDGPAIFHGRTSTNHKGLLNCHPMQREGWSLIHNGVVTDHGPKYEKLTTNDSEDVLRHLILGMPSVAKNLSGYYAFAAIDPDGKLHVAKDDTARLFTAWSGVIESYIFGTTYELIADISKQLKLNVGPIDAVESNHYLVLDGNEQVHHEVFVSRGWTQTESRHARASLGRSLDAMDKSESYETWQGASVYTGKSYASTTSTETKTGDGASLFRDDDTELDGGIAKEGWPSEEGGIASWAENEDAYYQLRHELENLDDSYTIFTEMGEILTAAQFLKLDHINQEQCYIERADGSIVQTDLWGRAD